MRIQRLGLTAKQIAVILLVLAACATLLQSARKSLYTKREKAYYADEKTIDFVRPGLVVKVVSAAVAQDGTITTRVTITDPKGVGLDRLGVQTPGAVSLSFIAATIPSSQVQYTAYTTRVKTSTINGKSAVQASGESNGVFTKNADGDYTYTFATKAPTGFDTHATHTIGVYGSRTLTEFQLPTNYASTTFNFVPDASPVVTVRDVVRNPGCNRCHDDLAFHGGSRRGVELCILCHTPQTVNPETGNTLDLKVMAHKVHAGSVLPSVQAGTPYQIVGFNNNVSDWSSVVFPADVRRCETCHMQDSGATQAQNYLTKPSRAVCGSCHDNVNFATGENHVNLPQVSDNQCSTCHIPQGELEFDASIKGAHTIETATTMAPGLVLNIVKVDNGVAGKKPTVTFTAKDNAGNPVAMSDLKVSPSRLALVLAGPTADYGYTNFGSDVTTGGYVSEDATAATCDGSGTCTYTFAHAIPADATGSFSVGIEGRRGYTILAGTQKQVATEVGAKNKVVSFSVDGSKMAARRTVVSIDKCNQCHVQLSLHGENRNQIEMCVLCHNPSETDKARRPSATVPSDKNTPPQAVNFAYMIHRIHTGENLESMNAGYTVVGFGGSHNDFSDVRYPAMGITGGVGDTTSCAMCHVNGSEQNLPMTANAVTNPQGPINPMPPTTGACLGCHANISAASHAMTNTSTLGESCDVCHGANGDYAVGKIHANR